MKNIPDVINQIKEKYPLYKELKTNFSIEISRSIFQSGMTHIFFDEYEFDVEKKQLFKKCFMINPDSYYKLKLVSNSKLNCFLNAITRNN